MKQKKLKVLVISNMFPYKGSYNGVFIQTQLEYLIRHGIDIIGVLKKRPTKFSYIIYILKSIFYVLFRDYDIIHAHYGFHSALIPAILKKKPLIITFHGSDILEEPYRNTLYFFFQKYVINRADHLIAVSNHLKIHIIKSFHITEKKISVISCGVNSQQFSPIPKALARGKKHIPENAKVVFFAGRIGFMKGIDVIYHCARILPEVLFIIGGTPIYKSKEINCKFIGAIENHDMPVWLSASDIYFLPSRSEGTSVSILEALSCEIPVVSSDVGGCPDIIEEGIHGYLVKVENPSIKGKITEIDFIEKYQLPKLQIEDIIKKIKILLENETQKSRMGKSGRELILKKYDNQLIASQISDIYNQYLLN